jgi:hypothetical protein
VSGPGFDLDQLALVARSVARSEALVSSHFRIPMLPCKQYPYEVVTLADLQAHERARRALAHLVVYERPRTSGPEHLYRICLQDDVILKRAQRGGEGGLAALLVYVLTHELVHVVRFQRAEQSFDASRRDRRREEDGVHRLTLELLEGAGEPRWERLEQLYGNPVVPALIRSPAGGE